MQKNKLNEPITPTRKLNEEELHHLASFPELNPNPTLEINLNGDICYLNSSAKRMIDENQDVKEIFLKKALSILNELSDEDTIKEIAKIKIGKAFFEQHFHYLSEHKRIRIYHRNVTEKEKILEELENQRIFFRQVIDLNPSFIFAKNRKGEFTLVNQAVADAYGTTVEDLVGKTDADFNDNPEEVEHFRKDDLEVMDSKKEKFIAEEVITDSKGNTRYLQTVKIPIESRNGSADQILGVATDISDRKQAEEERFKLESQIQHSQKLESLGVLAGGIAHDFNNLLMGIVGNTDLMLMDLEEDSPFKKKVKHIKAASRRLSELTNQLLAYSGRGAFLIENINLSLITEELTQLLKTVISKKAVLNLNLDKNLPTIKADVTQIRQIVMNLITNASDAIGNEAGEISLRTGTEYISKNITNYSFVAEQVAEGSYVFLEVSDTGCGMDKETIPKIFDPFFTTKFIGQGLGLAAVIGIVRSHKGTIAVKSTTNKGTSIKVIFPAYQERIQPTNSENNQKDASGILKEKKILIVDDEITMRSVTKSMLDKFNYKALLATNGNEAIEILKNEKDNIAAIILDLNMPGKDGKETLKEIRAIDANVTVILTSGYTELDATRDFEKNSFSSFIQKPFGPKELIETLLGAIKSSKD